ncbi:protease-associated domain-containing protein 1-like [Ciona intestinalis]
MRLRCRFNKLLVYATFVYATLTSYLITGYGINEQLWFEVLFPENVAYTYKIKSARDFGAVLSQPLQQVNLVPVVPAEACGQLLDNGHLLQNQVALITRGGCSFVTKAIHAELYGAAAVIISDHNFDSVTQWVDMIDDGSNRGRLVGIPAFYLLGKDGNMIREAVSGKNAAAAVINLPVNYTTIAPGALHQPPWDHW